MLLNPSFAFVTTTTRELWIEQVQEIYPCKRLAKKQVEKTPKHRVIKRLRTMQGLTVVDYIQSIFDLGMSDNSSQIAA